MDNTRNSFKNISVRHMFDVILDYLSFNTAYKSIEFKEDNVPIIRYSFFRIFK
jgi:hypothetical protein